MHAVERPAPAALFKAGSSSAARIAMMAMTTNNSISVKAGDLTPRNFTEGKEANEGSSEADIGGRTSLFG